MTILSQKKILVLGARNRRSLAFAAAESMRREGATLAFGIEPDPRASEKTRALLAEQFPDAPVFGCDVRHDEEIGALADRAADALGGLDGAVHAVAFAKLESLRGAFHENIDREGFSQALDVSAYSLTALARACLPHFEKAGGGAIVTLTYLGAQRAMPNYNVMGVAKAALEASARYLAFGMGPSAVRVNAISAGPVRTLAAAGIGEFGRILRLVREQAPLRRNIEAGEVGDACAFLLSDLARAITGEVLHVDAGFHITAGFPDPAASAAES